MICFYHSGDLDGKCAGALVKRKFPDCQLYGIDYGEDFPWEKVDEKVFMVDYSLSPEDMVKLNDMTFLYWCDHHASTIHRVVAAIQPKVIIGLYNDKFAACELVWKYLYSGDPIPLVVHHLGRYDVWDHSDSLTFPFQYGARLLNLDPENQELWSELLYASGTESFLFHSIIEKGRAIMLYEAKSSASLCYNASFEVIFEGRKCLALNALQVNSKVFDLVHNKDDYDLFIAFGYKRNAWKVSLYSEKEDTSLIAIKYGGGGHPGASGFICSALPFPLKREYSFS